MNYVGSSPTSYNKGIKFNGKTITFQVKDSDSIPGILNLTKKNLFTIYELIY